MPVSDVYTRSVTSTHYGVATMSRLLKILDLFCRKSSLLSGSFAQETYHLKEPTNRSHPTEKSTNSSRDKICAETHQYHAVHTYSNRRTTN